MLAWILFASLLKMKAHLVSLKLKQVAILLVSTNVGGIENVISDDETGYLSDVGDLEQFSINLTETY